MRAQGRLLAFVLIDRELPPPAAALLWVVLMMFAVSLATLFGVFASPVLGRWALLLAVGPVLLGLAAAASCVVCLAAWRRGGPTVPNIDLKGRRPALRPDPPEA